MNAETLKHILVVDLLYLCQSLAQNVDALLVDE